MPEIAERPKSVRAVAKDTTQRLFRHENTILAIVLVALGAAFALASGGLTTSRVNMTNVLLQSSIRGVASVGQAIVILTAGIDLSVAGVALFSSVLGATMMTKVAWLSFGGHPMSVLVVIPIMLLVGLAWGTINGLLVSRLSVPPLIVTLGIWQIANGAAFEVSHGASIGQLQEALLFFGAGSVAGVPMPVIAFVAVVAFAYFFLGYTTLGRSIYATGGNPISAWLSGIKVKNMQLLAYAISGFLAALAGVIFTARVMSASMSTASGLELDTIAAVCIGGVSLAGGRGSLIGVILGGIIIGVINNGMSILGAGPALMGIVKGAIIIAAVAADYHRRG